MKRFFLSFIIALAFLSGLNAQTAKPLAFYLKGLPAPRIGEWSDDQIRADLENKGFIVIDVDCSSFPRTSPELEERLFDFHKGCKSVYSAYENNSQKVDVNNILLIPEGYTATMNIPVWNIREHGAEGSVQNVMKFWNGNIVGKKTKTDGTAPEALPTAADGSFNPADADLMYNPDGSPIDWWLRMDIIHPSGNASASVPLLLNFATNGYRFSFANPGAEERTRRRNVIYWSFLTTGYAFANADHNWKPLARNDTWGYQDAYSLDPYNGLASTTAYVRYLKGHLSDYNLNGKIGCTGISKAAYSAMRIADPANATGSEQSMFNGKPNTNPQPWQGFDSTVDVAYSAAGNGTADVAKVLGSSSGSPYGKLVPIILSAGKSDQYNKWVEFPKVVKVFIDEDGLYLPFWMEDLGHTYPCVGVDVATGEKRSVLFKRFFDHYLKPDERTAADVLLAFPKDGATTDTKGMSRMLPPDEYLPGALYGVPLSTPVCVRFFEPYSLDEVSSKVTVTAKRDGSAVQGTWKASMRSTCFSFTPSKALTPGQSYIITVPAGITSGSGRRPSADFSREFRVFKEEYTGEPAILVTEDSKGNPRKLSFRAKYEDDIRSIAWFIDDAPASGSEIPLDEGVHKVKAVVDAGDEMGTIVFVKYITFR